MIELSLPWVELAVFVPLLGAAWVARYRDPDAARKWGLAFSGFSLLCAGGEYLDFVAHHSAEAHDRWSIAQQLLGYEPFVLDALSAPLLPMAALICFVTALATLRIKMRRFPFALALVTQAILLATFGCQHPWGVVGLMAIGVLPPLWDLWTRGKPMKVFALHMALFAAMLVAGWALIAQSPAATPSVAGVALLTAAVLLRSGIAPAHCWLTDLFEHASFGSAILFVTPMTGVYAAIRLLLATAPQESLRTIALLSLFTAVYAAGMALVQRDARRFFCYLLLSHSSLVLVGLEVASTIGLTGALWLWISVALSLTGFGLTLRAIESRAGRLELNQFHGMYEGSPTLAAFFLLTGLASVGFPGTVGFVGAELIVEGAVGVYPSVGLAVVLAAALNGIAVLQAYFRIFTGKPHVSSVSVSSRMPERLAVLALSVLILAGGLAPQAGLVTRHNVAQQIMAARAALDPPPDPQEDDGAIWFDGDDDVEQHANDDRAALDEDDVREVSGGAVASPSEEDD